MLSFLPQLVPAWLQPGASASSQMAELERLRWAGLCLFSLAGLVVYLLIWRLGRQRLVTVAVLVTFIHVLGQIFLLRPMLPMERIDAFSTPADLLAAIPEGAIVTHGKSNGLFGPVEVPFERFPDTSVKWLQKQIFEELYPVAGTLAGRRFDFSISAEGLDSFLTRATAQSLKPLPDTQRVRLLAASGVTRLILGRELESVTEDEARLVYRGESVGGEVFVYEMMAATPEVFFVGEVLRAPHLNAALEWITAEDFDPTSTVVLPEGGQPRRGPPGRVDILYSSAEAIEVEVEAPSAGVLVVQRSFLPIYRARVDQEEVPIVVANMHRLGVELEPGQHTVEIWIDRRPTRIAVFASLLGLVSLGILAWRFRG